MPAHEPSQRASGHRFRSWFEFAPAVARRDFSNSAMAFRVLDAPSLRDLLGYSEFLNTPSDGDLLKKDLPKRQNLLLHFKKNIA